MKKSSSVDARRGVAPGVHCTRDTRPYESVVQPTQPYGISRVMGRQEAVPASSDEGENSDVTCTDRPVGLSAEHLSTARCTGAAAAVPVAARRQSTTQHEVG